MNQVAVKTARITQSDIEQIAYQSLRGNILDLIDGQKNGLRIPASQLEQCRDLLSSIIDKERVSA